MTISPLEVGLGISLLCSVVALIVAIKSVFSLRQRHAEMEKMSQRLSREIFLSTTGVVNIGQRLLSLERRVYSETPQAAESAPASPKLDYYNNDDFQPYSQAAQLFKMGLDTDEVARRCGLSRAETSLIQMMQAKDSEVK